MAFMDVLTHPAILRRRAAGNVPSEIQQLRRQFTVDELTIIVASAHAFQTDRNSSLTAGADAFLSKPIDIELLLNTLQESLEIEWIYEKAQTNNDLRAADDRPQNDGLSQSQSSTIIPPNKETLDNLYHLSMMGDLNKIKGILDQLEAETPNLTNFTTELRALAQGFQTKQIREFIKSFT